MITENTIVKMTLGGGEDPMEKLTRLIIERDELLFHVVPELKAEYMLKVGALEHLVWKKRLELSMAKRRLSLIRSYLNRQEEPDSEAIEETIRFEYENLLDDLKERNEEIKKLVGLISAEKLSQEDTEEIRSLYTKTVKKLHPDLNPDASIADIALFQKAVEAYKRADIFMIRAIYSSLDFDEPCRVYAESVKAKIAELEQQIEIIRSSYPFDKIPFMQDRDAVRQRNAELNEMLDSITEDLELVNRTIAEVTA